MNALKAAFAAITVSLALVVASTTTGCGGGSDIIGPEPCRIVERSSTFIGANSLHEARAKANEMETRGQYSNCRITGVTIGDPATFGHRVTCQKCVGGGK